MALRVVLTSLALLWATTPAISEEFTVEDQQVETQADGPCWNNLDRYVVCGNGTVNDTVTGLLWHQAGTCTQLPGVDFSGTANWPTAQEAVASLEDGVCGLADGSQPGDWRLPTIEEWMETISRAVGLGCRAGGPGNPPSLTEITGFHCFDLGPQQFVAVQNSYWSSTIDEVSTNRAWRVDLNDGAVDAVFTKSSTFGVWAVRDGR